MRAVRSFSWVLILALASTPAAAKPQVGAIAGFNLSNLSIEAVPSGLNVRSTFAGGAVLDLGINDKVGIRIEPMYLSKGAKAAERNAYWGTITEAAFQLDYIDVPILARIDLAATPTRGYLLAGVGVGFATQLEVQLTDGTASEKVDFSDVFSSMDVSVNLGAGVSLPVGANRMTFDARGAYGLTNINQGGTVTFAGNSLTVPPTSTHTLDFRLFATYLFPWPGN